MSKRKLLLADDSVTIQKVVNLTFADEGIEVIAVGDGNTAMEKFVESTPDLVMVDVNMPGFDGYKICEIIKQDEETKHIPVILLVGSFEPFDEEEAWRVGADDYLTKPFQSIRQLVSKVTALLDSSIVSGDAVSAIDQNPAAENQTGELSPETIGGTEAAHGWAAGGNPNPFGSDFNISGKDNEETNGETAPLTQIGSLPADETQKFSYASTSDTNAAQTQLLSDDELPEINREFGVESTATEKVYEFADAENYQPQKADDDFATESLSEESNQEEDVLETGQPIPDSSGDPNPAKTARDGNLSLLDIDEINLLEISFDEDDEFYGFEDETIEEVNLIGETEPENIETRLRETESNRYEYAAAEEEAEAAATEADEVIVEAVELKETDDRYQPEIQNQTFENGPEASLHHSPAADAGNAPAADMSPELIDRIAAKVIEKLSDKVIREIAWEVVPQMADSIVRKMADEKLNR